MNGKFGLMYGKLTYYFSGKLKFVDNTSIRRWLKCVDHTDYRLIYICFIFLYCSIIINRVIAC